MFEEKKPGVSCQGKFLNSPVVRQDVGDLDYNPCFSLFLCSPKRF